MIQPMSATEFLGGRTRFGLLVFEEEVSPRVVRRRDGERRVRLGRFRCACGGDAVKELRNVRRGLTRSCGCHSGHPFADAAASGAGGDE